MPFLPNGQSKFRPRRKTEAEGHWCYVQRDAGAGQVEQLDGNVKNGNRCIKTLLQGVGRMVLVWH